MLKVIDNEKMVIYFPDYSDHPKRSNHIISIPHLKCCNANMVEQAAYLDNYENSYELKDNEGLCLVRVKEKHPQYFECPICRKIKIRRYFQTINYIKAYQGRNPFYFTAITDDINKMLTFERFIKILLDYDTNNSNKRNCNRIIQVFRWLGRF